ncbi:hypothetical protein DWW52_17540 [Odoribacter sp. AF15-53]|nr:hypothetical protein DWW52_17540 [Odoribacter sp. AF15-53]
MFQIHVQTPSLSGYTLYKRGLRKSPFQRKQLPPPAPPYTGGELITKQLPLLCKEGTGVVVQDYGTFSAASFIEEVAEEFMKEN